MKHLLIFVMMVAPLHGQTLDQRLRQTPSSSEVQRATQFNSLGIASGITSLTIPQDTVEESRVGNLIVYYPKGYGRNVLHFGVWNAIPFIVYNNVSMEVRFGLIFEHRQVGFVPDEWVSTSISSSGLPTLDFLIPNTKTFLNFTQGSSQWRATVLLTESQIMQLEQYQYDTGEAITISANHRFMNGSSRPYMLGSRHRELFRVMIELYGEIVRLPNVKIFRSTDAFPSGGFFDELTVDVITENIIEIDEQVIEGEEYYEYYNDDYYYE